LVSAYAICVSALLWWLIPVGATVLAVAWAMYRARPERPTEAIEGMEHLRRMQMAIQRPLPGDGQRKPSSWRASLERLWRRPSAGGPADGEAGPQQGPEGAPRRGKGTAA